MNRNEATIAGFYSAFAELDGEAMERCYAEEAEFDDEVFSLRGRREIGGMWRMLCAGVRARDRDAWRLDFGAVEAVGGEGGIGRAHWEPRYRFSATGRMVHNVIDAHFVFDAHGLIRQHRDRFDFWRWSRQALGMPGVLLGWTPLIRNQVRAQARARLEAFVARDPTAGGGSSPGSASR